MKVHLLQQVNVSGAIQGSDKMLPARHVVPDLKDITNCSFYWGKIDQHAAAKLLEGKPEGTFLLRDSAQEEYLFSVSVRVNGRTFNARVEQYDNLYSFGYSDFPLHSSPTVTGLIEHYKTNPCCMLYGSMLTTPLQRDFPLSLKHHARAAICSSLTHDSVNELQLPQVLKIYLMEYHHKQRVRILE